MRQSNREPDSEQALSALESVLLVAGGPVGVSQLGEALDLPPSTVLSLVETLRHSLRGGIRVQVHNGEVQLATAPENVHVVQRFLGTARPPALSRPALEALTIIAYRQPVTRAEVEAMRGVNSDRAIHTLMARGLIQETGRRNTPGRPTEYGTAIGFLEYFGLSSLEELPPLPQSEPEVIEPTALGMRLEADQTQ